MRIPPSRAVRRCAAVLVCFVVGLAAPLGAGAAGASPTAVRGPGDPDTTDALVALQSEVLALIDLGAFAEPIPQKLHEVHDEWSSWTEGLNHDSLLTWVRSADEDGAAALGRMPATAVLSPDVRTALGLLPPEAIRALESYQPANLSATVYEHALNDLEFRNGAGPSGASGPPPTAPLSVPSSTPASQPPTTRPATSTPETAVVDPDVGPTFDRAGQTQSTSRSSDSGGEFPTAGVVVGGILLLLGAAAGGVLAARRRGPAEQTNVVTRLDDAVARLLDAGRRFGSSIEAAEIVTILTEEARALTRSDRVAVLLTENDGALRAAAEDPVPFVDIDRLERSAIRRVAETGTPYRSVVDDPAVEGAGALIVVPLVRDGVVAGAVVCGRDADRPYEQSELDLMGQLVPMAAAALIAAGRHDDVAALSLTDGLTELGNRRRLDRDLVAALAVGSGTIGFVMVDIDHFKHYNDTHGHVAGDEALRMVAHLLRTSVRSGDVVYRYGGEEFCVLLPGATQAEAVEVAERLRTTVEAHDFPGAELQPGGRLTISVGMTVAERSDPRLVKERADQALYEAKHRGRNQVVVDGA